MLATTLCAYIVWLVLYEYTTTMSLEYACTLRAPGTISYALYTCALANIRETAAALPTMHNRAEGVTLPTTDIQIGS